MFEQFKWIKRSVVGDMAVDKYPERESHFESSSQIRGYKIRYCWVLSCAHATAYWTCAFSALLQIERIGGKQ